MYTDTDLDNAVTAGIIPPESAAALRRYLSGAAGAGQVDEEQFRLLTGFNDIFVAIATILLLSALAWIGSTIVIGDRVEFVGPARWPMHHQLAPFGGLFVAAAAWGLSEYFTRIRRMALPSILLLLAFVGGLAATVERITVFALTDYTAIQTGVSISLAGAIAAIAAALHWRRFHVPITIAALSAGIVGIAVGITVTLIPALERYVTVVALIAGIGVFAFAMRWDMSDPARTTRRADVAFWLHLLAAPLIVHPVFKLLGLLDGGATMTEAALVIVLYVLLGIVALVVDRRALMVSALFYVLYALAELFRQFGAVSLNLALTGLVIGSALLLLSAFWHTARAAIVGRLSSGLRARLPVSGPVSPRPA